MDNFSYLNNYPAYVVKQQPICRRQGLLFHSVVLICITNLDLLTVSNTNVVGNDLANAIVFDRGAGKLIRAHFIYYTFV